MKVETTNLTSLPLCLTVVGIRTREIAVQVLDRNHYTTSLILCFIFSFTASQIEEISEDKASRCLQRLKLLNKIRNQVYVRNLRCFFFCIFRKLIFLKSNCDILMHLRNSVFLVLSFAKTNSVRFVYGKLFKFLTFILYCTLCIVCI